MTTEEQEGAKKPVGLITDAGALREKFLKAGTDVIKTPEIWKSLPPENRQTIDRYLRAHEYLAARETRKALKAEGIETRIVPAVQIALLQNGPNGIEVFMGKRIVGGYEGQWSPPGGKIDPGETSEAAALRELREETGLDLSFEYLVPVGRYISQTVREKDGKKINFEYHIKGFLVLANGLEPYNASEGEYSKTDWTSVEKLVARHEASLAAQAEGTATPVEDAVTPRAFGVIKEFAGYDSAEEAITDLWASKAP